MGAAVSIPHNAGEAAAYANGYADGQRAINAYADGQRAINAELLEALQELCDYVAADEEHGDGAFDGSCLICAAHLKARAVIAKATKGEA